MKSRRNFLKATVGTLGVVAATPVAAGARIKGANNRIRLGVVGCGHRAARVFDSFALHTDAQWLAGCEVDATQLQRFMTPARQTFRLQTVTDYRRILDRHDIDAVLISTPDFSHAKIMVDAVTSGKDVYVETPASDSISRLNAMHDAFTTSNRIVQIGTQHRSGEQFAKARRIIDSGILGTIRHVAVVPPGRDASRRQGSQDLADGLDLIDVAHWFMNADATVPRTTAAIGVSLNRPSPGPEHVPDAFSISWEYDTFVMTFANRQVPRLQDDLEGWGTFFIGGDGSLQVNRRGYALRAPMPRTVGALGPAINRNISVNSGGSGDDDRPLDAHVRNFLDCIKSREQPNADMTVGYHSALPCLLARQSMQQHKVLGWDAVARTATTLERSPGTL